MKPAAVARVKSIFGLITVFVIAGILLPVLMIEIAAFIKPTLIPPEIRTSIFQVDPPFKVLIPDPELGYKFAPNLYDYPASFDAQQTYSISTQSLGYDNIGFRDDGLDGPAYAVVIGDSFAACAGIAQDVCWVEQLEKLTGHDFANLGVLGYAPQQEARMLVRYGLPLQPELVLWVFFANDLKDAWRFNYFGSGAARQTEFWHKPVQPWLVEHSAVYTTLSFFWYNRYFFREVLAHRHNNPQFIWWQANTDRAIPEVAEGLTLTRAIILDAARRTRQAGAQFVMVILPFREQVYASPPEQTRFDQLNADLSASLQSHGLTVIDATPFIRARAKTEPSLIYFEKDIHLNAQGNRIVAEILKDELEKFAAGHY